MVGGKCSGFYVVLLEEVICFIFFLVGFKGIKEFLNSVFW